MVKLHFTLLPKVVIWIFANIFLSLYRGVDKNPEDNVGFTPLHYAAILDNLEIFKFIVTNVENENPVKGSGIMPYHCAIYLGKKEICQFIEEKYNIKTNSNAVVLSETDKIKINISNLKALEQNVMPLNNCFKSRKSQNSGEKVC